MLRFHVHTSGFWVVINSGLGMAFRQVERDHISVKITIGKNLYHPAIYPLCIPFDSVYIHLTQGGGRSSVVEHFVANEDVESSNLFARSNISHIFQTIFT
jgi:hypothetical protein